MSLMRTSLDTLTDRERRFAELLEALYETGYLAAYAERPIGTVRYLSERCIGCGLCAVACDPQHAVAMAPTPGYRRPPGNLLSSLLRMGPKTLRNAWSAWRRWGGGQGRSEYRSV